MDEGDYEIEHLLQAVLPGLLQQHLEGLRARAKPRRGAREPVRARVRRATSSSR